MSMNVKILEQRKKGKRKRSNVTYSNEKRSCRVLSFPHPEKLCDIIEKAVQVEIPNSFN